MSADSAKWMNHVEAMLIEAIVTTNGSCILCADRSVPRSNLLLAIRPFPLPQIFRWQAG